MDADPEYKTFIENIIKTNSNIKIMDIQDNPVINTWARKYGFNIVELAMIQPHYDRPMIQQNYHRPCVFCFDKGTITIISYAVISYLIILL